ncbi:MAG: hypothetical protein ACLFM6_03700, partial [Spirochaetaceae bacterium]
GGPPPPVEWPPLPESRRYRDIPRPLVWAPYVSFYAGSGGDLRAPVGAYVYGAGLLGRTEWDSVLAADPVAMQPEIAVSAAYDPGPVRISYGFDYRYRPAPGGRTDGEDDEGDAFEVSMMNRLLVGAMPWYARHPAAESAVRTTLGAALQARRTAGSDFAATDTFGGTTVERELHVLARGSIEHVAFSPQAAYFGGFAAATGTEVRYTPRALDAAENRVESTSHALLRVPSGVAQHVVGLRFESETSTDGGPRAYAWPRSGMPGRSADGDVAAAMTLDYGLPLGLYDRPLIGPRPYKPALLGAGMTLYAEDAWFFDIDTGRLQPEEDLIFGIETEGRFTALGLPLRAGAGLAARVERGFGEPLSEDDLRFYAFFSSEVIRQTRSSADRLVPGGYAARREDDLP